MHRIIDRVSEADTDPDGAGSLLDELVGSFYDAASVARHLTLTEGELVEMVAVGQLIAVPLAAGTPVYPAWQFRFERQVNERLLTVWQVLREAADPWTAAAWMCAPSRDLVGQTAIAYLADGEQEDTRLSTVLDRAAEDCARWLQ